MTVSRRAAVFSLGLVAVVLTGCSTTVTGSGAMAPVTGAPEVRTATQLAALLVAVPTGAHPATGTYASQRTLTLAQFAAGAYDDPTEGTAYLQRLGVTAIAHVGWTATNGHGAEVVLFLFGDTNGPYTWMSGETSALREDGSLRATLDDVPSAVGYTFTAADLHPDLHPRVDAGTVGNS